MEFATFTYTKATGEASEREAIILSKPSKNYMMLDVKEMLPDEFAEFAQRFQQLKAKYDEDMAALMDEYELRHKLRNFSPDGISDMDTTWM